MPSGSASLAEAAALLLRALEMTKNRVGPDGVRSIVIVARLSVTLGSNRRTEESDILLRRGLAVEEGRPGGHSSLVAPVLCKLVATGFLWRSA